MTKDLHENSVFVNFTTKCITGNRIEDFFYEKIDKKKPNRLSNLEYVGTDMIEAGNDFGPGIAYGWYMYICKFIGKNN